MTETTIAPAQAVDLEVCELCGEPADWFDATLEVCASPVHAMRDRAPATRIVRYCPTETSEP